MRLRLVLAAAAATFAVAPLAPAHASTCNEQMFPEVCAALGAVCRSTEVTRQVCRQFG